MLSNEEKLIVQPYLSIRKNGNDIYVGELPPIAYIIEDSPAYIDQIFNQFSTPTYPKNVYKILSESYDITKDEFYKNINQLQELNILISSSVYSNDRYSRHALYYAMEGLNHRDCQYFLKSKTVGLIGMGGVGSCVAMNLVAAGIGHLIITDGDIIELSNLTRQYLYTEKDIGRLKVDVAKERLNAINSDVIIDKIPLYFSDISLVEMVGKNSDFIFLSADKPYSVHQWLNNACIKHNIPYSNAGYIEGHGVVGPLFVPNITACYECYKDKGDFYKASDENLYQIELNKNYQAPAYGPLNAIISAIQSNEIIRYLTGNKKIATFGNRLVVDSRSYEVFFEEFSKNKFCKICNPNNSMHSSKKYQQRACSDIEILSLYEEEREKKSFSSILIDEYIFSLPIKKQDIILDFGSGSGYNSIILSKKCKKIIAVEKSDEMIENFRKRLKPECDVIKEKIEIIKGDIDRLRSFKNIDIILCLNVLDFIDNIDSYLISFYETLNNKGRLILSIPHPIKDLGFWRKTRKTDSWDYDCFILEDYFTEGECSKRREDFNGDTTVENVISYHRTISSYYNSLMSSGFLCDRIYEPKPKQIHKHSHPVLYSKCHRIPYFLIFECHKDL